MDPQILRGKRTVETGGLERDCAPEGLFYGCLDDVAMLGVIGNEQTPCRLDR